MNEPDPATPTTTARSARSGIFLVLAIFVFGGLILGGMYLSPPPRVPAAPSTASPEIPERQLRFVSLDARRKHLATEPVLANVQRLAPDYLMLQDIESEDVVPVSEALGMQASYHPTLFERSENLAGRHASWGTAVLSRHELDEGAPIAGPSGVFGTWATAVIDGRRFLVASVRLSPGEVGAEEGRRMIDAWRARGAPPIVVAGLTQGGLTRADLVGRGTGWFDGLTPFLGLTGGLPPGVAGDVRILFSPGWSSIGGGAVDAAGAGAAPVWVVGTSARAAVSTTTRTSTSGDPFDEP